MNSETRAPGISNKKQRLDKCDKNIPVDSEKTSFFFSDLKNLFLSKFLWQIIQFRSKIN